MFNISTYLPFWKLVFLRTHKLSQCCSNLKCYLIMQWCWIVLKKSILLALAANINMRPWIVSSCFSWAYPMPSANSMGAETSLLKLGSTDVDKIFKAEILALIVYLLTLRRTGTSSSLQLSSKIVLVSVYCAEKQK